MPDRDGYEILPSRSRDVSTVLHFPCGQRVRNLPRPRREHLRDCERRQRDEQRAQERERAAAARATLRTVNRERALERRVLGQASAPQGALFQ
jgi:hypothetical protein